MKQKQGYKTPGRRPDPKRKRQPHEQILSAKHKRSRMEIAAYITGIGAVIVFGLAALLGVLHMRDASLWTTWLASVLTLTGGFCWLQDREWKKDAAAASPVVPHAERASLVLRHLSLVNLGTNQVPFANIGIENLGKVDAIDVEQESALITRTEKLTGDPPPLSRDNPPVKTMVPVGHAIKITATAGPLLSTAAAEAIKEQKVFVYVYGVIRYYSRHFPKDEQTLKFCSLYDPVLHGFKQTPFHNTTQ